MSFLSPIFLLGAAAIAIPIAIHLFYRRTEPLIEFAAMRYLRRAPVEQSQRRKVRELVLLALRVAALLLLALAFARPYLTASAVALGAQATVVMIDTSVSLSAPGLFARAQTRASELIRGAPLTHAVAVVAFAHGADVIAPLSEDRAGALAAIAQLKGGAGMTRYRAALARAAEEFGDRSGRLVVISDLQQAGWDASDEGGVPDRVTVDIEDVGGPAGNLAVTSLRAEGAEAVATVRNLSSRPAEEQVVFTVDARRLGAVPVSIGAGGTAEARLALDGLTSGGLSASISDREGFQADNVRHAVMETADAPSILAITASGSPAEALYLERAVSIAEGAGGFRFRTVSGPAFSALPPEILADASVIVILGTRGLEQRGRERLAAFVRAGGGLLVTAGPDVDPAVLAEALNGVVKTSWRPRDPAALSFAPDDARHPVFRLFAGVGSLGNVSFARAALVDAPAGADVLARYSDGSAALVEERTPAGRALVFGSDLNNQWNDFPLQPAFVPFVHETLRYLAATRVSRSEYLVGDLPGSEGSVPGFITVPVARTLSGPRGEPDKARPRRVAVNVDPRESDPARMTADAFRAGVTRLNATAAQREGIEAREQEDGQRLWQYGLLLMVIGLAAEGILGRRLG